MGLVVPIACGNRLAVLAFTLRQWLGTGGLRGHCASCLAAGPLPPGVLTRARNSGEVVGEPMKLVSMGEPE